MALDWKESLNYAKVFKAHPGLTRLFEDFAGIQLGNPHAMTPVSEMRGQRIADSNRSHELNPELFKHAERLGAPTGPVAQAVVHISDWLNTGPAVASVLAEHQGSKTAFLEAMAGIQTAAINTGTADPKFFEEALKIQQDQGLELGQK